MFCFAITIPSVAHAEGAIAAGVRSNGLEARAYSINYPTQQEASTAALQSCMNARLYNCSIIHTFRNACLTYVSNLSLGIHDLFFTDAELQIILPQCQANGFVCQRQRQVCDTVDEAQQQAKVRENAEWRATIERQAEEQENAREAARQKRATEKAYQEALYERMRARDAEDKLKELQTPLGFLTYYVGTPSVSIAATITESPALIAALSASGAGLLTALFFVGYQRRTSKQPASPKPQPPPVRDPQPQPDPTPHDAFASAPPPVPEPQPVANAPTAAHRSPLQSLFNPIRSSEDLPPEERAVKMQASISHAQERKNYYVTLKLLFSPGAQLLIKARQLQDMTVISGLPGPPLTRHGILAMAYGAGAFAYVFPFIFIGSFIWGVVGGGSGAGLLMFGSVAGMLYAWFGPKKHIEARDVQRYTIAHLLRNPTVRLWASDPVGAKIIDDEIRENLKLLRAYLEESKTLPQAETFDV